MSLDSLRKEAGLASGEAIRLNLGCASRPLPGYVNIDMDDVDAIRRRYPNVDIPAGAKIFQFDIFQLPFEDGTIDEVRADAMVEHLSFLEESKFFYEAKRVLKRGGLIKFSVPDFEKAVRMWLDAKDDWKDFFRNDPEAIRQEHWFGQYSYTLDQRWGYLTATLFGPQNGEGQFHRNCYTVSKIRAIFKRLDFAEVTISEYLWKGKREPMIDAVASKN